MKSARNKKAAVTRRAKPVAKFARSAKKKPAPPSAAASGSAEIQAAAAAAVMTQVATPAVTTASPVAAATAPAAPQRAGLKLESTFTLRDANDMLFQLLAVDFGDSDVLVDGGAVERIDTAGLQMLIAFAKAHAARGKTLHWSAVSPELLRSSQLLGVTEPLHLGAHLSEGASGGH